MCHLVDISHHCKIVFMSSTALRRAVSWALTLIAAACWWVILLSGISSDCNWAPCVAGRKLCVKWKMNILATFCIIFATREAGRHSVFQDLNVRKICQQNQRHKLAHCEGLSTFGNRKLCCIKFVCARVCIKHCCKAWLRELLSTWIRVYQQSP